MIQKEQNIHRTGGNDYFISEEAKSFVDPESIITSSPSSLQQQPSSLEEPSSSKYKQTNLDQPSFKIEINFSDPSSSQTLMGLLSSYRVYESIDHIHLNRSYCFSITKRVASELVKIPSKPVSVKVGDHSIASVRSLEIKISEDRPKATLELELQLVQ